MARRAAAHVPAYGKHLAAASIKQPESVSWQQLPLVDKKNYLLKHSFDELLADDFTDSFTIFSSSGSSGHPFYWPQLKGTQRESAGRLKEFLEEVFRIHERPTLAVVGLALGSWIGGEHFSWALKSLAVQTPYPFAIFSPGSHHDEILTMIESAGRFVEQMIVFVCPSAIGHLRLRAEQQGQALPLSKLRFVVIGEPFPETVRLELQEASGVPPTEPVMLSIFGSADTGVLGFESPGSAMIRGMCQRDETLAAELGFDGVLPHLFHQADPAAFLETVDGELCVTKWQGVPLVRYNLHDAARLMSWRSIVELACARLGPEGEALRASAETMPDVLAITGRADSCLMLTGTNLTEAMLDSAVRADELSEWLSGNYRARSRLDDGRQRLEFTLECRGEALPDGETTDAIYSQLVKTLGRAQPEFNDDWQNIYCRWDDDPELRILALKFVAWPELADSSGIKQRGLQP